jgi:hypothetical protein
VGGLLHPKKTHVLLIVSISTLRGVAEKGYIEIHRKDKSMRFPFIDYDYRAFTRHLCTPFLLGWKREEGGV